MPADVTAEPVDAALVAPLRAAADRLLSHLGQSEAELSVSLVDDETMRGLNASYRGKDRTTDVLAFADDASDSTGPTHDLDAMTDNTGAVGAAGVVGVPRVDQAAPVSASGTRTSSDATDSATGPAVSLVGTDPVVPDAARLLGDVVISVPTAAVQAVAGGWELAEEINRLLVHGLLHLLGYDHEGDADRARIMRGEEKRLADTLLDAGVPCARVETDPQREAGLEEQH